MLNKYLVLLLLSSLSLLSLSAYGRYPSSRLCNSPGYECYQDRTGRLVVVPRNYERFHHPVNRRSSYYDHDNGYDAYDDQDSDRGSRHGSVPSRISGGNIIKVNLGSLTWAAYDHSGSLVKSGHVSGGKEYCPDIHRGCRTVTGTFTIYRKQGAGCKSTRFPVRKGGAPMPYCMFFHGGYALHGSNAVPNYNASHGCVRMPPSDARWLNENFVNVGSTRVSVTY